MIKKELIYLLAISFLLLYPCNAGAQRWYATTNEIGQAIDYNIENAKDSIFLLDVDNETSMYICLYIDAYFGQPKDIGFLISSFNNSSDSANMRFAFSNTFRLLEKYRDDLLVYADDSVTAIFYKTIDLSNLVAASVCAKSERDNYGKYITMYCFYDGEGYYTYTEEKGNQYRKEHYAILRKYDGWLPAIHISPNDFPHEMFFLEYTPEQGLVNAETREPVDVGKSEYYKEVEQWMRETCKKNGYSKMLIPSPIPCSAPFVKPL